jgi:hypothetical protein
VSHCEPTAGVDIRGISRSKIYISEAHVEIQSLQVPICRFATAVVISDRHVLKARGLLEENQSADDNKGYINSERHAQGERTKVKNEVKGILIPTAHDAEARR